MIVMRKIKDPRIGFVTVTDVEVTVDLKIARVYISVLDRDSVDETLAILNAAKGFIRSELSKTVRMKVIPQIEFHQDESIAYGERIDRLLRQIREEQ